MIEHLPLVSLIAYLVSGVLFSVELAMRSKTTAKLAYAAQIVGLIAGGIGFVSLWQSSGYPPLRNIYETVLLMGHCVVAWNLVQAAVSRVPALGPISGFVGALMLAWVTQLAGPSETTMPALQHSLWLTVHVIIIIMAYAAVLIASICALLSLSGKPGVLRISASAVMSLMISSGLATLVILLIRSFGLVEFEGVGSLGGTLLISALIGGSLLLPLLYWAFTRWGVYEAFEDGEAMGPFIHRTAALAFVLTTLGILTGSVWGDVAWGRYWGWDPKEVWALITWLSLLCWFHLRRPAPSLAKWSLVIGLLTVLFNYFGVNFLLPGLHSYAG